jgi:hypothetical protein
MCIVRGLQEEGEGKVSERRRNARGSGKTIGLREETRETD